MASGDGAKIDKEIQKRKLQEAVDSLRHPEVKVAYKSGEIIDKAQKLGVDIKSRKWYYRELEEIQGVRKLGTSGHGGSYFWILYADMDADDSRYREGDRVKAEKFENIKDMVNFADAD